MKAVQYTAFNQPLTSVTLPTPAPAKGEVLVKTAAAAINPIDFKVRDGVDMCDVCLDGLRAGKRRKQHKQANVPARVC